MLAVYNYGSAVQSDLGEMKTNVQLATPKQILSYSSIC